jgi:hypothetical protein
MKKITLFALLSIVGFAFGYGVMEVFEAPGMGTALPSGTAIFETSLASPITESATSMTLAANSIRGGGSLSGYECFTIDEGSAQAEFVCGTVSGTSVTNLERGISPADGITEDPDLQFSHRRGASVKITDFPLLQRLKLQASGQGTYEALLSYAAGVTPISASNLTDVEYVLSVVNGGTVSFDRMVVTGTAGSAFATGTIVYKSLSDGRWYPADADDTTTYIDRVIGIAQSPGSTGVAISRGVLLRGFDNTVTGLTANTRVFLSSTAGAATTTAGAQFLGVAESASSFLFLPIQLESTYRAPITFSGATVFSGTTTFSGATIGATRKIIASSTQQALTGTSENTIFSTIVPPGLLGSNNAIRYRVYVSDLDFSAGGQVLAFRLTYGGTLLASTTLSGGSTDTNLKGSIEGTLYAASTTSQFSVLQYFFSEDKQLFGDYGSDTGTLFAQRQITGTSSVNSEANQTLSLTVQAVAGVGSPTLTLAGLVIETIQ